MKAHCEKWIEMQKESLKALMESARKMESKRLNKSLK